MKIFVFDTETTWFIDKKESDLDKQPYVIQFAWILGDIDKNWEFKEEERVNIIINPWSPIPYGSSQIHHIYDIDVKNKPKIDKAIEDILHYINSPDIIIWHNIEYDESMIKLELQRLNRVHDYKPKQTFCTMNESINYCKLPKRNENSPGYKRPKLGELHKKLFNKYFIWAHDAMVDVEATLKCFVELYKRDIIQVEEIEESVMSLF